MKAISILIYTFLFIFNLPATGQSEEMPHRFSSGSTSIDLLLDSDANGLGNLFSPALQYFFADNLFIEGGLRYSQGTANSEGQPHDIRTGGILLGLGSAFSLSHLAAFSLEAAYSYFSYDDAINGVSQPGSQEANSIQMRGLFEFFLTDRTSLGIGIGYSVLSGTSRDTTFSFDNHTTFLTTGWKFYLK
jgi:hypothetical protein